KIHASRGRIGRLSSHTFAQPEGHMNPIIEKLLHPEIVWVLIPLAAIVFFGAAGIIRALRGVPASTDDVEAELQDLRRRVEELERERGRQDGTRPPAVAR